MIYVECDGDTTLGAVLVGKPNIQHLFGKSRVCRKLMAGTNCKGIVDEDRRTQDHPYFKEIRRSGSITVHNPHGLVVCEDTQRRNRLILLRPKLEVWIITATQAAGKTMQQYSLPNNADELHNLLRFRNNREMANFRMLIQNLRRCSAKLQALETLLK